MKNVVLFDLDGTLTPPRGRITSENADQLLVLLRHSRVGIVTGSTLQYVIEQIEHSLFEAGLEVFPCNGTEHWKLVNGTWMSQSEPISMRDYVGGEWRRLHMILHSLQGDVMEVMPELPLTGQFVSYRGSMMNWCPIGREAGPADRATFEKIDIQHSIRAGLLITLRDRLSTMSKKLTVKLGGSTSFDIYPAGWDKSYVLSRFKDEKVWFVGDRCGPTGNDYEIYEALKPAGQSFKVEGPDDTAAVIYEIMLMTEVLCDEMRSPPY